MRDWDDFNEQFRESPEERNDRLRQQRHQRTVETLRKLLYDMSGFLADEGDDLTDAGLANLRRRMANALGALCPEWLERFRDPAVTGGGDHV